MKQLVQNQDGSYSVVDPEEYGFGFQDVIDFIDPRTSPLTQYVPGLLPGQSLGDMFSGKVPSLGDMARGVANPFAFLQQGSHAPSKPAPKAPMLPNVQGAYQPRPAAQYQMLPTTGLQYTPPLQVPPGMLQRAPYDTNMLQRLAMAERVNDQQQQALAQLMGLVGSLGYSADLQHGAWPRVPQANTSEQPYGIGSVSCAAGAPGAAAPLSNTPTDTLRPARLVLQASELTGALQVDPLNMLEVVDIRVNNVTVLQGGTGVLPAGLFSAENTKQLSWTFEVRANQPFTVILQNRHATLPIQCSASLVQVVQRF